MVPDYSIIMWRDQAFKVRLKLTLRLKTETYTIPIPRLHRSSDSDLLGNPLPPRSQPIQICNRACGARKTRSLVGP